jgi:hypothetical protein
MFEQFILKRVLNNPRVNIRLPECPFFDFLPATVYDIKNNEIFAGPSCFGDLLKKYAGVSFKEFKKNIKLWVHYPASHFKKEGWIPSPPFPCKDSHRIIEKTLVEYFFQNILTLNIYDNFCYFLKGIKIKHYKLFYSHSSILRRIRKRTIKNSEYVVFNDHFIMFIWDDLKDDRALNSDFQSYLSTIFNELVEAKKLIRERDGTYRYGMSFLKDKGLKGD